MPCYTRNYWKALAVYTSLLLVTGVLLLTGCRGVPPSVPEPVKGRVNVGGTNLLLIIDSSGSMKWNDPERFRIEASQICVALAEKRDNVGVIIFSSEARTLADLQAMESISVKEDIQKAIETTSPLRGTNFIDALRVGAQVLNANPRGRTGVLFLSDGEHNTGGPVSKVLEELEPYKVNEWPLYSVALTPKGDSELLRRMAAETGGAYFWAANASELFEIFAEIARNFWDYVDTKSPTVLVPPETRRLMFLALRKDKKVAIKEVSRGGLPVVADEFFPSKDLDARARKDFELWNKYSPSKGIYTADLINEGKIMSVMAEFPISFTLVKDQPRAEYQEGWEDIEIIEIGVLMSGPTSEIVEFFRDKVKLSAELQSLQVSERTYKVDKDKFAAKGEVQQLRESSDYGIYFLGTHPPLKFSKPGLSEEYFNVKVEVSIEVDKDYFWQRTLYTSFKLIPRGITLSPDPIDFGLIPAGQRHVEKTLWADLPVGTPAALVRRSVDAKDIPGKVNVWLGRLGQDRVELIPGKNPYPILLEVSECKSGGPYTCTIEFAVIGEKAVLKTPRIGAQFSREEVTINVIPERIDLGDIPAGMETPFREELNISTECESDISVKINVEADKDSRLERHWIEGLPNKISVSKKTSPRSFSLIFAPSEDFVGLSKGNIIFEPLGGEKKEVGISAFVLPQVRSEPATVDFGTLTAQEGPQRVISKLSSPAKEPLRISLTIEDLYNASKNRKIVSDQVTLSAGEILLLPGKATEVVLDIDIRENVFDDLYKGILEVRWNDKKVLVIPAQIVVDRVPGRP